MSSTTFSSRRHECRDIHRGRCRSRLDSLRNSSDTTHGANGHRLPPELDDECQSLSPPRPRDVQFNSELLSVTRQQVFLESRGAASQSVGSRRSIEANTSDVHGVLDDCVDVESCGLGNEGISRFPWVGRPREYRRLATRRSRLSLGQVRRRCVRKFSVEPDRGESWLPGGKAHGGHGRGARSRGRHPEPRSCSMSLASSRASAT